MYSKHEVIVNGSPMPIFVFEPESQGPHPGMVVCQHLPVAHAGIEKDPFTLDVGEKLASEGYLAIIPFMFHWWPPEADIEEKREAWRDDWNVADLIATWDFTTSLPNIDADRIGIMGHCWGGRVTWLGACTNPQYAAAAVFYGGRIKIGLGPNSKPPIEMSDQINCPVLGIFGNDDQNPSPADVVDLDKALNASNIIHEFHCYDGAGHGFQDFVNESRFKKEQTADAWGKFFEFMGRYLKAS